MDSRDVTQLARLGGQCFYLCSLLAGPFVFFCVCEDLSICIYVCEFYVYHVCVGVCRSKTMVDSLELEFQVLVSLHMSAGSEPGFSERVVSTFTCCGVSLAGPLVLDPFPLNGAELEDFSLLLEACLHYVALADMQLHV